MKLSDDVSLWMRELPEQPKGIVCELRATLQNASMDLEEQFKWKRPVYRHKAGSICHISVHQAHVNLGFDLGSSLTDPSGLLEGSGKNLRHIKIYTLGTIPREVILNLVQQSITVRQQT